MRFAEQVCRAFHARKYLSILAPLVEEITKSEKENYYEWLTCPHDRHGNTRWLEVGRQLHTCEIH